jgi:LacI family transcriptional regulator, repressor for deo operon, udp, cdd, tsx, nupC, and nupG
VAVSLKDVATLAGVSIKTVSNVVNEYRYVSIRTRARVQAAIDQLGYRPNLTARNLRTMRTGMLALAIPQLDNAYFAELARDVVDAARDRGYTVLIDKTDGDPGREREVLESVGTRLVDGVILAPIGLAPEELAGCPGATPLVLLGERRVRWSADHVGADSVAMACAATGHLISVGRSRIAAVGHQPQRWASTSRQRLAGYKRTLRAAGLPVETRLVVPTPMLFRRHGVEAADVLLALENPPDAIFCFNDPLALGVIRRLHERGVRVPDDIAVVGVDDVEEGRFSVPTLTTVAPDKRVIAERAVSMVLERISGSVSAPPREVVVEHRLRIRESSGGGSS